MFISYVGQLCRVDLPKTAEQQIHQLDRELSKTKYYWTSEACTTKPFLCTNILHNPISWRVSCYQIPNLKACLHYGKNCAKLVV
jgi:hypothetical protein